MQYGIGIGSSKKQAKLDAARATLEILLPSVKNHIQINRRHAMNEHHVPSNLDGGNAVSITPKLINSEKVVGDDTGSRNIVVIIV